MRRMLPGNTVFPIMHLLSLGIDPYDAFPLAHPPTKSSSLGQRRWNNDEWGFPEASVTTFRL